LDQISFAVEKLSRYTSNPSALYWQALGRINNMEDYSSMSGWVFLLGGAGSEAEWLINLVYEIPL
ncbi:hypothetical protein Tco_0292991, partial [Tanacetum coccineum]